MRKTTLAYLGTTFFRLTILKFTGKNKRCEPIVECACSCGVVKEYNLWHVVGGDSKSCGCLLKEKLALPTALRSVTGRKRKQGKNKRASQIKWVKKNPDKVSATAKRFRENNRDLVKASKAAYYQANKRKIIDKLNARFRDDLRFRIEQLLRSRVRKTIRLAKAVKSARTLDLTGCSVDFLLKHIESQFRDGMSWEHVMSGEVHIDHREPCAKFNLLDPEEQRKCFHYSNLQPLWAEDNLRKSDILPCGTRARFLPSSVHVAPGFLSQGEGIPAPASVL